MQSFRNAVGGGSAKNISIAEVSTLLKRQFRRFESIAFAGKLL
jgi:hypothetical protein